MFRLRLLGGAGLEGPDGPLGGAVARRHPLALLALLDRSPRRSVSRDRSIGLLWPEASEEAARNRLRTTLHTLRRALGSEAVLSEGDQLRLNEALVTSDVEAFERSIEEGDADAALALYTGPFLDGFHLNGEGIFDRWADGERFELARLHEESLEGAAEAAAAAGDPAEAARWWERVALEQPLATRAVVGAMEAWTAAGERGRALETARAHAVRLREAFDVEPPEEIVELERRLRSPGTGAGGAVGTRAGQASFATHMGGPDGSSAGESTGDGDPHPGGPEAPRKPGRRTFAAAAALGLVALFATVPAALAPSGEPPPEPAADLVLVSAFRTEVDDPSLEYLGTLASDWIARGMVEMGGVSVVPWYGGFAADDDPVAGVPAREAAASTGAGLFVTGTVRAGRDSVFLQARIGDTRHGTLVRLIDPVAVPVADAARGVQLLGERTTAALATHRDPKLTRWAGAARQPPDLEAYRHFAEGLERFTAYPSDWDAAVESFLRASESDPGFTLPLLWAIYVGHGSGPSPRRDSLVQLVEARYDGLNRWEQAFFDAVVAAGQGDLAGAYGGFGEVVRLTPRADFTFELARTALGLNRPAEAVRLLRSVDPPTGWMKESPFFHYHLTRALHVLGEHEEELSEARRFLARFPTHGNAMGNVAMALIGLGRVDEALAFVDSVAAAAPDQASTVYNWVAVDLRAHGYRDEGRMMQEREVAALEKDEAWRSGRWGAPSRARVFLAERLLRADRPGEAYDLLSAAFADDPDDARTLLGLAEAAYRTGREAEARKAAERLDRIGASPAVMTMGVAVTGRSREALELLRTAGIHPIFLHLDPRLETLRSQTGFRELTTPEG